MSKTATFDEALELLEMNHPSSGFRWVADIDNELNPYVYLELERAKYFEAKGVYVRFFADERPPKPQIYFYFYESEEESLKFGPEIHQRLWNSGTVPICFIFSPTKILVFNCSLMPIIGNGKDIFTTQPHDFINLLSRSKHNYEKYSARKFDSGLFWDSDTSFKFKYDQSAYEKLLNQLKNVKERIIKEFGTDKSKIVKRILMMLILLKYLEERKDENGNGALNAQSFYLSFNKINPTLTGVLDNADQFIEMLDHLSSDEHFNGQMFSLNIEEKKQVRQMNLFLFQKFVDGDISIFSPKIKEIGQMSIWKLYQFNYLPIELISHIYEDFLADDDGKKIKGVVYTPPSLVQLLIDQTMPLNTPKKNFRVFDPSCGSGIFLVGAFKRMIQWWRLNNNWTKPTKENIWELKKILSECIYGCDIQNEAVQLTYFSLGLALLDSLSPKEIWNNVHFDNLLESNLFSADFFKVLQNSDVLDKFDLVIGNPPFEASLSKAAAELDFYLGKENNSRPNIPNKQIALLFLESSFKLLKNNGTCCLILPSGSLLYDVNSLT